jgi:hypothetical protein
MNDSEIRERAQAIGITGFDEMNKGEMIRAIQRTEGYRECFGHLWRFDCLEYDCCWREDCLTMKSGVNLQGFY